MNSLKNKLPAREFCDRAIAYVKGLLEDNDQDSAPEVPLGFDDTPVFRPLCDGLGITYVVDAGDCFEYVQNRDIEAAGLTVEQLHQIALGNLVGICREKLQIQSYANIWTFLMGGNFEASCILINDLFDRVMAEHVANGYVAAIAARDIFAVCSRDEVNGIRELRELIERVSSGDHLISKLLFVREGGIWRPEREGEFAD